MIKKKYNTEQKKELLEYMIKNKNSFVSAEDIVKHLKDKNINIGLTTIYRFLNSLEEQEKLRVEYRNHTKFYQYISNECDAHYHLKCKDCGKLIHFECEELKHLNSHISEEHNFIIDSSAMIYGICDNCNKKEKEKGKQNII